MVGKLAQAAVTDLREMRVILADPARVVLNAANVYENADSTQMMPWGGSPHGIARCCVVGAAGVVRALRTSGSIWAGDDAISKCVHYLLEKAANDLGLADETDALRVGRHLELIDHAIELAGVSDG